VLSYLHAAEDANVRAMVLVAPVSSWARTFDKSGFKETSVFKGLGLKFIEDAKKYDLKEYAKHIRVPTMIVQGGKDTVVKKADVEKFVYLLGCKKKFVIFPKADHDFHNDEETARKLEREYFNEDWEKVQKLALNWFKENLL